MTLSYTSATVHVDLWQLDKTLKPTDKVDRVPYATDCFSSSGGKQPSLQIAVSHDASKIAVIPVPPPDGELVKIRGVKLFGCPDYFVPAFLKQQQRHANGSVDSSTPSPSLALIRLSTIESDAALCRFIGYGRFHFFDPTEKTNAKEYFIAYDGLTVFVYNTVQSWSLLRSIPLMAPSGPLYSSKAMWDMWGSPKALVDSLQGPLCLLYYRHFVLVLNLQTASEVSHLALPCTDQLTLSPYGNMVAVGSAGTLGMYSADRGLWLSKPDNGSFVVFKSLSFTDQGRRLMAETPDSNVLLLDPLNLNMTGDASKMLLKAPGDWMVAQVSIEPFTDQSGERDKKQDRDSKGGPADRNGLPRSDISDMVLTWEGSSLTVRPLTTSAFKLETTEFEMSECKTIDRDCNTIDRMWYPTQASCDERCRTGKQPPTDLPRECETPSRLHFQLQVRVSVNDATMVLMMKRSTSSSDSTGDRDIQSFYCGKIPDRAKAFFLPCRTRYLIDDGHTAQVWKLPEDYDNPVCELLLMVTGSYELCRHGKVIYLPRSPRKPGSCWFECTEAARSSIEHAELCIDGVSNIVNLYEHKITDKDHRKALLNYLAWHINTYPDPNDFTFSVIYYLLYCDSLDFLRDFLVCQSPKPTWIPEMHYKVKDSNPIAEMVKEAKVSPRYLATASALVEYCVQMAKQEGNTTYLTSVIAALPAIIESHPHFALDVVRKMAFIPLGGESIAPTVMRAILRRPPTVFQKIQHILSRNPQVMPSEDEVRGSSSFYEFAHATFQMHSLLPINRPMLDLASNFPYEVYVAPVELIWAVINKETSNTNETSWWKKMLRFHVMKQDFSQEFFDNPAILAVLEYKWYGSQTHKNALSSCRSLILIRLIYNAIYLSSRNTFARSYWLARFTFQCLYYVLVLTTTLLQVYSSRPSDLTGAFIAIIVYSSVFLCLEVIQFVKGKRDYVMSPYNWIDVFVFALPLAASVLQLKQIADPALITHQSPRAFSFSILLIYLHLVRNLIQNISCTSSLQSCRREVILF